MNDYIVTRTTTETFGMKAESMKDANEAFNEGQGELINATTQTTIRPRPTAGAVGPQNSVRGSGVVDPRLLGKPQSKPLEQLAKATIVDG